MTDNNTIATDSATIDWLDLGATAHFENNSIAEGELPSGLPLAIYRVEDEFFVTSDRCTHGSASLSDEGELEGHVVQCAWHNGTFDIRTGAALTLPCRSPLPTFTTKIENDHLLINPKPNKRQQAK